MKVLAINGSPSKDKGNTALILTLAGAGFDQSRKALFVMEWLLYYLPPPLVHSLFEEIACNAAPGSKILFDYYPQSLIDGTNPSVVAERLRQHMMRMDEPFLFGIPDEGVVEFLSRFGYRNVRDVTDSEYLQELFSGHVAGRKTTGLLGFCSAGVPYDRSGTEGGRG
jgi:O-methyltransferase involved in polyketide biosynthesis